MARRDDGDGLNGAHDVEYILAGSDFFSTGRESIISKGSLRVLFQSFFSPGNHSYRRVLE